MRDRRVLMFIPFRLDLGAERLWRDTAVVRLTAKAFAVLRYLVLHAGHLVTKDELVEAVWALPVVSDAALTVCIGEIRRALGDTVRAPQFLETVRGRGYRFCAPVTVDPPAPGRLGVGDLLPEAVHLLPLQPQSSPVLVSPAPREAPEQALEEEYKLVTVLCCAVTDAPTQAVRLLPEATYRLMQTVVTTVQEVLQRYDGTLLPPTSEEITAVFGAPVAQEDHARRAVLAALDLQQRLRQHPALRAELAGADRAVRMAVHSGLVVVGGLGQDPQRFATVVGAPVELARRLQAQAAPGTLLLSAATYQLVHAEVRVTPGDPLTVAGHPTPMPVYTVHGLVGRHAGVVGRGPRARSPYVGRERELGILHDCLALAGTGQGQVVGLVGEPGLGKTRLVTEFCQRLAGQRVTVAVGHCLSYGQAIPYLPVRALLQQLGALGEADQATARPAAVQAWLQARGISAEEDVALVGQLLDLEVAPEGLARLSLPARRARTFALLRHLLLAAAQPQPLVLVVENLHWCDATSAEWLTSLVERLAGVAVLLVATYRPGYQPPWGRHSTFTQVSLAPLRARDSRVVLQAVLGAVALPEARLRALVARAAGNPFFLEELAWHTRDQDSLATPEVVPGTVHAVVAARLDRLPPAVKRLAQTAAVIGMEVPWPLVQALADEPEDRLQQGLAQLQAAEFLSETTLFPESAYTFKHALTQEVAYNTVLLERRRVLHERTAQAIERLYAARLPEHYPALAHHYTRSGNATKAVDYLHRAGQQALERSAYAEAISHLTAALDLLSTLPESRARRQQELAVQLTLGPALMATTGRGAPEMERLYTRARALCEQVGEPLQLFRVLWGLQGVYGARGAYQQERAVGEDLLSLARHLQHPDLLLEAHHALWSTLFFGGELVAARCHQEQGLRLYDPQRHRAHAALYSGHDPGVCGGMHAGLCLWLLGYPDQAVASMQAALALAQQLAHPYSLTFALHWAAMLHQVRREPSLVQARAEAAMTIATEQEFLELVARTTPLRGWALAACGRAEEGRTQLQQGVAAYQATGMTGFRAYSLALLAEVCAQMEHASEGLEALAEALATLTTSGHPWWEAELYRLRGELLLHSGAQPGEAEACVQRALAVARRQQARSLELRAALSLGRLWQRQGKRQEAYDLLAPIYHWFTEGFDTVDLQEAKALLEEAGEPLP